MKKLTILALAMAIIAGCSKEENAIVDSTNVVKFSSGAISRVSSDGDDYWEVNDAIGLFTVGFDGVNGATDYSNVKYVSDLEAASASTGFTAAVTSEQILFPNVESANVTFYAYYPYSSDYIMYDDGSKGVVKMDVSGQGSDYGSVDFITASATVTGYGVGSATNNTPVALSFSHKLAKVVLNITKQDNLSSIDALTTTFNGLYTYKYYDYLGAEADDVDKEVSTVDKASDIGDFVVNSTPTTVTAILHPMAATDCGDASITFTVAEGSATRTFSVPFDGVALTAGSIHSYNIALGNDTPTLGNCIINKWDDDETSEELYSTED
ncbi:MAG: fimbrillin family protein [Rikenellaceae bacterium]